MRPKITGIAHISLYTEELKNAESLFKDYLGFGTAHFVKGKNGAPDMMYVKINDRQYVEFTEDKEDRLVKYLHTAYETDDVEAMRLYLRSMGVEVPEAVSVNGDLGYKSLTVRDFNRQDVEFVEYTGKGWYGKQKGKAVPPTAISSNMRHTGWICPDSDKDIDFYCRILGFTEFWRGGEKPDQINWIKLRLPDSGPNGDYIELMLFDHDLDRTELGLYNHLDIEMDDVAAAKKILDTRKLPEGCKPAENQSKGVCGYGLSNVYLRDETRIELMTKIALGGTPSKSTYGKPLRYDGDLTHLLHYGNAKNKK